MTISIISSEPPYKDDNVQSLSDLEVDVNLTLFASKNNNLSG